MAEYSPAKSYEFLAEKEFISLTTYQADGTPITSPCWFAPGEDCIFIEARSQDEVVRRIQFNPRVQVAAYDARTYPIGEPVDSIARIMTALDMHRAKFALQEKYGLKKFATGMLQVFQPGERLYIELKPA
ncbi:MAG TPA: pyridoxamine 5'-phosphate oxidase family protein [Aggregatilineales bacterium]|nr:pyridoxamine 5'-phosphate oxidase family protein [Aggregatilineales bacterium]